MSDGKPKRVAVMIDVALHGGRQIVADIAAWARRHADWRFVLQESRLQEQQLDPVALNVDGAVVAGTKLDVLRRLRRAHIPYVVSDPLPRNWRKHSILREAPVVKIDSRNIGSLAAEYLLERRYRSFAFVPESFAEEPDWSAERRIGFAERLARAGFACSTYARPSPLEREDWNRERLRMMKWLSALAKPTAILVAMDGRARLVLDACSEAGIAVPNELAVIGVDDDPLICETTYPRLSSIRVAEVGQRAAAMLAAHMDGTPLPDLPAEAYPAAVVERESTGHNALAHPVLARGLSYIRLTAGSRSIGVPDVVARMGCSRRTAEQLFVDQVGHSIKREITRVRFNAVKDLLQSTNMTISDISERCGFPSECHLSRRFSELFGMTMTAYRAKPSRSAPQ